MKKLIIYSFTVLTALSVMVSCRKNDNPKLPALVSVPEMQFTKAANSDAIIAFQNPDAFSGKFTVGTYFPGAAAPQKIDLVIIKNGVYSSAKSLLANITTFPTTVTITGVQIKTIFGTAIALGDSYDIGATITTTDGTVIPAFSALQAAASYNSGVTAQGTTGPANTSLPPAAPTINYSAVCKFTMTDYGAIGATVPFKVIEDGWADYNPGDIIPVKIIDATHLSFFYGTDVNPAPVVITVDPVTNSTTAANAPIGKYSSLASYGTWSVVTVPDAVKDVVLPCQLRVGVNLNFQASGTGGTYVGGPITLQKN